MSVSSGRKERVADGAAGILCWIKRRGVFFKEEAMGSGREEVLQTGLHGVGFVW